MLSGHGDGQCSPRGDRNGLHVTPQLSVVPCRLVLPFCTASDASASTEEDPFAEDPERHPALIVHTQRPFNGEPPTELLATDITTPTELFYIRNHLPVPHVDLANYALEIEASTSTESHKSFKLDELQTQFKHVRICVCSS
jgi:hypothetical protein